MFAIFALVSIILAIIGIMIATENANVPNSWETIGVVIFALGVIAFCGFIAAQIIVDDNSAARQEKRLNTLNRQVVRDCLPYAVVHRHDSDGYIVYACADDNKIKVLKK